MIVALVGFLVSMALLAALQVWQFRTIRRLEEQAKGDNFIKVRLREELWALAEKHGEHVPFIYFAGIWGDKPIERWETPATPAKRDDTARTALGAHGEGE